MAFIWACSVYSPLVAIHFLNRPIHSRKTACKVTFSIHSRTPSTTARSWSASSNERPARHLLTYPKSQKADGARSGDYGGCGTDFIRFSLKYWVDNLAVFGCALSACTNHFHSLPAALIQRHWNNCSNISATQEPVLNFRPFSTTLINWNLPGFQIIVSIIFSIELCVVLFRERFHLVIARRIHNPYSGKTKTRRGRRCQPCSIALDLEHSK
jgi:hypothetical protein